MGMYSGCQQLQPEKGHPELLLQKVPGRMPHPVGGTVYMTLCLLACR